MKTRFTLSLLSLLLVGGFYTSSQAQIPLRDEMGRPLVAKQYVDVKGSPYLFEEWVEGSVKLADGTIYDNIALMYDQVEHKVIFMTENNQTQVFLQPVVEFTLRSKQGSTVLQERRFRKGYRPIDGASDLAYYEVLADGKTELLKRTAKNVFENTPYGTATKQKTFKETEFYYVTITDKLVKIQKDKKSVLRALPGHTTSQLEQYIKSNDLNLKKDEDLAKLIAYHNSLNKNSHTYTGAA